MDQPTPPTWAIVELMGHVKLAGRLTEEEKFGSKIGRLDIPAIEKCTCPNAARQTVDGPSLSCAECHGSGLVTRWITQYFGGGTVYRISIVSEAVARHVAKSAASMMPVSSWDFPKPTTPAALPAPVADREPMYRDDDDHDYEDDELP